VQETSSSVPDHAFSWDIISLTKQLCIQYVFCECSHVYSFCWWAVWTRLCRLFWENGDTCFVVFHDDFWHCCFVIL